MSVTSFHLRLEQELLDRLRSEKPKYVSLSGFCSILFQEALDARATLITPSTSGFTPATQTGESVISTTSNTSNNKISNTSLVPKKNTRAKQTDPFARKTLPDDAIPNDLLDVQQLLEEFWSVKKGVRSERAWNRLCNKLRTFTPEDRRKGLEAACTAGWADVYEPKPERSAPYAKPERKSLMEQAREIGLIQ